jgi:diaminopimelate epimerase
MIGGASMVPGSKFHAYGNDFLIVESHHLPENQEEEFSRKVCTAHFGVGADGCVILKKCFSKGFMLKIFNLDGSQAGMSGNGVRCAAAYVHKRQLTGSSEVHFQTISGEKIYRLVGDRPPVWTYVSEIGFPSFEADEIPIDTSLAQRQRYRYRLSVVGSELEVIPLSVGNPQCAVFVDELPASAEFERIGGALEKHAFFPDRTNVSFVQVVGPHEIMIKIWERGVGPTHSSGTGSSGAAVAGIVEGVVSSPVEVRTATGTQVVAWEPGGQVKLSGDAEFVADFNFCWRGKFE